MSPLTAFGSSFLPYARRMIAIHDDTVGLLRSWPSSGPVGLPPGVLANGALANGALTNGALTGGFGLEAQMARAAAE